MADKTPEQVAADVAEVAKKLQELKTLQNELSNEQKAMFSMYAMVLQQMKAASDQQTTFLQQKQRELQLQQQSGVADNEKIKKIQQEIQTNQEMADAYVANQARIDTALQGTREKSLSFQEEQRGSLDQTAATREQLRQQEEQTLNNLVDLGGRTVAGMAGGTAEIFSGLIDNPDIAFMTATFPGLMTNMGTDMKTMITEADAARHEFAKNTGVAFGETAESMKNLIAMGADPMLFHRMADPAQIEVLNNLGGAIEGVGNRASHSVGALMSIHENVNEFRPSFMRANSGLAVFAGNLVTSLTKINVQTDTSTKTIDKMNRAIGLSPERSVKAIKSLVSVSDSLEISANRAFTNFNLTMPTLSQYGEEAIGVYSRLEAQSLSTGIGVDRLTNYAKGLDTFKGAAEAAQKFNAVMGDTYLSVSDLADADHDEKILMIQDAMERSGVSFETADRKMQQVIASALGLNDAEEARRMLMSGTSDDYEIRAAKIDTGVKSQEDMKLQLEGTMGSIETLTKNFSSLEGGMSQWVDRTKGFAVKGADIMLGAMTEVLSVTQDMESAAIATVTAFDVFAQGGERFITAVKGGNLSEALAALAGPALLGGAGVFAEDVAREVGVTPIPKEPGAPGARPIETTQEQLQEGATGNNELLLRIAEGLESRQIVEADVTTNLVLDGETIQKITQKTSSGASDRVKDDMRRKAQGLPTVRP